VDMVVTLIGKNMTRFEYVDKGVVAGDFVIDYGYRASAVRLRASISEINYMLNADNMLYSNLRLMCPI
jgi:hypothetical protein